MVAEMEEAELELEAGHPELQGKWAEGHPE